MTRDLAQPGDQTAKRECVDGLRAPRHTPDLRTAQAIPDTTSAQSYKVMFSSHPSPVTKSRFPGPPAHPSPVRKSRFPSPPAHPSPVTKSRFLSPSPESQSHVFQGPPAPAQESQSHVFSAPARSHKVTFSRAPQPQPKSHKVTFATALPARSQSHVCQGPPAHPSPVTQSRFHSVWVAFGLSTGQPAASPPKRALTAQQGTQLRKHFVKGPGTPGARSQVLDQDWLPNLGKRRFGRRAGDANRPTCKPPCLLTQRPQREADDVVAATTSVMEGAWERHTPRANSQQTSTPTEGFVAQVGRWHTRSAHPKN